MGIMNNLDKAKKIYVLDLIILIGTSALGFSFSRNLQKFASISIDISVYEKTNNGIQGVTKKTLWYLSSERTGMWPDKKVHFWMIFRRVSVQAAPCLTAWTLGLLLLWLTRFKTRPSQQGPSIIFAVVVAVLLSSLVAALESAQFLLPLFFHHTSKTENTWWAQYWATLPVIAGLSVCSACIALCIEGGWRNKRSILDILGKYIGIAWILNGLLSLLAEWLRVLGY